MRRSVDFAVSYAFAEYRSFVLEHVSHVRGRAPSWIGRQFIVGIATPLFWIKKHRMPQCEFRIDAEGIRRTTAGGTLNLPWSKVIAIHRYSPGYLIEKVGGAFPIPYRCLTDNQRGDLEQFVVLRERELSGHGTVNDA